MNEEGGGLHLRSASSCGKTTIQRVATSVWRNPSRVGSWRATANGIEAAAKTFNSTLLSLDEIAEIDGRHLGDATYMLANGTGKARANAHGGANPLAAWRVAILSTGEIGIAEKLAEAGRKVMAGHDVRLIDLEGDSGRYGAFDDLHGCASGAEFPNRLKRLSADWYGTAGQAFVERLIRNRTKIADHGQIFMDHIMDRWNREFSISDDGQALRVARRLAMIGYAGEVAGKADLTGWTAGSAVDAARVALELWLEGRRAALGDKGRAAKDRMRAFLLANSDGFAEPGPSGSVVKPGIHGWKTGDQFLISSSCWHAIHGERSMEAARDLEVAGLLVPGEKRNRMRHTPRWADGRPRVYVVRRKILEEPVSPEATQTA